MKTTKRKRVFDNYCSQIWNELKIKEDFATNAVDLRFKYSYSHWIDTYWKDANAKYIHTWVMNDYDTYISLHRMEKVKRIFGIMIGIDMDEFNNIDYISAIYVINGIYTVSCHHAFLRNYGMIVGTFEKAEIVKSNMPIHC